MATTKKQPKERVYRVLYKTKSGKNFKENKVFQNEKEAEKWVRKQGEMATFSIKYLGWN